MKYKTLGEMLAFIRDHLDECEREEVRFSIYRIGSHDGKCFRNATRIVNTIYTVSLLNSLVVDVEQVDFDTHSKCLLIKVLV